MALVRINDLEYVNPDDVYRIEGYPLDLAINVLLRCGHSMTHFISEERIAYRMKPSSSDPENWSAQQKDFYIALTGYGYHGEPIDKRMKGTVACFMHCTSREQAFGLELKSFAAQFNK